MKLPRLGLLLLLFALSARADIAPEKRQEIDRLMRLTGMVSLMDQMKGQMIANYRKTMPLVAGEFWTRFQDRIDMKQLLERIVPIYDKHYTIEDLKAVNAFYETPAGRKLLSSLPAVMQESMQVGQQWGQELGQSIGAELAAEAQGKAK